MRIDALVTDVNLPGLSGPELAVRARAVAPAIGVVFATGDNAVSGAVAGAVVLAKPYGDDALGTAIIEAAGFALMGGTHAGVKSDHAPVPGADTKTE